MNLNRKYIIILAGTFLIFVLIQVFSPRQINWIPTFSSTDKNPFGSYVLNEQLKKLFPDQPMVNSNLTLYELFADSISDDENIIVFASDISMQAADTETLLDAVAKGAHAFLSANYFSGKLADTLGIEMENVITKIKLFEPEKLQDSSYVYFTHDIQKKYPFKLEDIYTYFNNLDSLKSSAYVVSRNEYKEATTLRIPWGQGQLILNSTPLAFTNNYLLYHNEQYIEKSLSYLPVKPVWWTEFYQMGRRESESPLRVILNDEALAWAYYITIFSLLLFIVFESKRKQRIIPIVKPPSNSTLQFVRTIGTMYIEAGDHKSIAEKKITYFIDYVRVNYFLPGEHNQAFIELLARKSGNTKEDTQALMTLINVIQHSKSISSQMLQDLNKKMEQFNHLKGKLQFQNDK